MSLAAEHAQRVCRLYRNSLRTALNWAISRDLFNQEARRIRRMFEKNRDVTDLAEATRLVEQGEKYLKSKEHPDPWIREFSSIIFNSYRVFSRVGAWRFKISAK